MSTRRLLSTLWAAVTRTLSAIAITLLFVTSLVAGIVVHLDTRAGRRLVREQVSKLVSDAIEGELRITSLDHLTVFGIDGLAGIVRAPDGTVVVRADGVSAGLHPVELVSELLSAGRIVVARVTVAGADVDMSGPTWDELAVARAFETTPSETTSSSSLAVALEDVLLRRVTVSSDGTTLPFGATITSARGSLSAGDVVAIDVTHAEIATRGLLDEAELDGVARLALVVEETTRLGASFEGRIGEAPVALRGQWGELVSARLQIGPIPSATIRRLVPSLDVKDDVVVALDAHGPLSDVALRLDVRADRAGSLDLASRAQVGAGSPPRTGLEGRLAFRSVDLTRVLGSAPPSDLTGSGALALTVEPELTASLRLDTEPSTIDGEALPPLTLRATYEDDRVTSVLSARGREIDARVEASANLARSNPVVDVNATIDRLELSRLPLAQPAVRGTAAGAVRGRLTFDDDGPWVDARVDLSVTDAALSDARAGTLRVSGTARGHLDDPSLDVDASARDLDAAGQFFRTASASFEGQLASLRTNVELSGGTGAVEDALASAEIRVAGDSVVVASPRVELTRDGRTIRAQAERLVVTPNLAVDDLQVTAPGFDASADVDLLPNGRWSIEVSAEDMDLSEVLGMAGLEAPVEGQASVNADIVVGGSTLDGTVALSWRDVKAFGFDDLSGELNLDASRQALAVDLEADGGPIEDLSIEARLRPRGSVLDPAAYARATGELTVSTQVDLGALREVLEPHVTLPPLPRVDGRAGLRLEVDRDDSEPSPNVAVELTLDDTVVRPRGQFARALDGAFWPADVTLTGVDAALEASVDAASGLLDVEVRLHDEKGELVALDGDLEVPWAAAWRGLTSGRGGVKADWWRSARAHFWSRIPRRRLQSLPGFDEVGVASGDIRLVVHGHGTGDEPNVDVTLRSFGTASTSVPVDHPVDVVVVGEIRAEHSEARLKVFAPKRQLGVAHVRFHGSAARTLLDASDDWTIDAHSQLCSLPLETIAPLQQYLVRGEASGTIDLEGLNSEHPRVATNLEVEKLRIGQAQYRGLRLTGETKGEQTHLEAHIAQAEGGLEVKADLPIAWRGVIPHTIEGRAVDLTVVADRFDVRALSPFVEASVVELAGRLDGKLEGTIGPRPTVTGHLSWSEGRIQLVGLNTRFDDIEAEVDTDGRGRLVLQSLRAKSMDGVVEAKGTAHIDGISLRTAELDLAIPNDRPIPLVVSGQSYGRVSLATRAEIRRADGGYRADVRVKRVHVELPRTLGSDAEALEPAPFVNFGTRQDEVFVPLRLSPPEEESTGDTTPLLVRLQLDDVELSRHDLSAYLVGNPEIEMGDELRMRGQIRITGGRLEVQGRRFDIEGGTIRFDNRPPDDPVVNVKASWDAPDGTTVYAKYLGPVSTGEVSLSSDPPRPKSQLLSLLLFGDANHQIGGGDSGGATGQAVGLGGSVLAKGLNAAIDDLVDLDIRARLDTTSSSNPEAELEWRVAREFSLAISHVLGLPEPGESPDRNYAGIEWRFAHEWSLETTVGDQGSTSVDVLWQHSY